MSERSSRVMMVGLDGFELSVAEGLLVRGRLPGLARLKAKGATLLLDHGDAKRTGLAWEHISTGLCPDDARRWSAVDFDRETYAVAQRPTSRIPFAANLDCLSVVFDAPYFDLMRAPAVQGLVGWGAHDPGVPSTANPASLSREVAGRFGSYPAGKWLYGFVWPSVARTQAMAAALTRALQVRSAISAWLFGERCPDWKLGLVVISEYHSATEALWHGIDPSHPLHELPSGPWARDGIERVYEEGDRMISRLMDRFPDAQFVVFNLHGMGPNDSDAASMALLPELLYRQQFGARCLDATDNRPAMTAVPLVRARQSWNNVVDQALPPPLRQRRRIVRWYDRIRSAIAPAGNANSISLDWMPAARYRCFWPAMRAFALPSFYDGRIRINLRGRESNGIVEPEAYEAACDEVESVLRECRNFSTGEAIVARIDRNSHPPGSLADSEADIMVVWRGAALGFDHPRLGRIGPLPYRRTGGHTGDSGIAYFFGPDIGPGEYDKRSAFDIVPTVIEMLGESASMPVSGKSFHADIAMSAVREHSGPDEQFNCIGTCCTIAPGSASEISMRVNR